MSQSTESGITAPETIKLDQFLKVMGVVQTGGQAKLLIQAGEVKVNGTVETRRGRKLVVGDRVATMGDTFKVTPALFAVPAVDATDTEAN